MAQRRCRLAPDEAPPVPPGQKTWAPQPQHQAAECHRTSAESEGCPTSSTTQEDPPTTTARPEVLSPFINVQQMRPETPRGATRGNRRAHRKLKVIKDVRRRGRPPTEPPVTGGQAASRGNNGDHSNKRGLLLGSPSCADPERLLTPKADFGVS